MSRPLKGMFRPKKRKARVTLRCPAGLDHSRLKDADYTNRHGLEFLFRIGWQDLHDRSDWLGNYIVTGDKNIGSATPRDRVVAASVIQWLGTSVGFAFLCQVLREWNNDEDVIGLVDGLFSPYSRALPRLVMKHVADLKENARRQRGEGDHEGRRIILPRE